MATKPAGKDTPQLCTRFHYASELIGRRWNGAIIFMLLKQTSRFATLRDGIPDITDRMLSERLQELVGVGGHRLGGSEPRPERGWRGDRGRTAVPIDPGLEHDPAGAILEDKRDGFIEQAASRPA